MTSNSTCDLVTSALAAVREARERAHLARGWQALHRRDAEGNPAELLPYADAAFREFQLGYQRDSDDAQAIHHLAICHHARAWDWEIAGDPRAKREWEAALGFWRRVANSPLFWSHLQDRLQTCDPQIDPEYLKGERRNLLENLLDIHVEFVRHYCGCNELRRATTHVEIIHRASIPPAVKKRLVDKVFEAMSAAIPDARQSGTFASALDSIERFLDIFSDYLPALRIHAELCSESLERLSFREDWVEIQELARRAEPYARRLMQHSDKDAHRLAVGAAAELGGKFCERSFDRTINLVGGRQFSELRVDDRQALKEGFGLGITWGRIVIKDSTSGARVRPMLAACLQNHAFYLAKEADEVMASRVNHRMKVDTALSLFRPAAAETEEALRYSPDEEQLQKNLIAFQSHITMLELSI